MTYVTLAELGNYFQEDVSDVDTASWLTFHATLAEEMINGYCDTSFTSTGANDVQKLFSAEGRSVVIVNPLLRSFSKVEIFDSMTNSVVKDITNDVTLFPKVGYVSTVLGLHKAITYKDNETFFPEGYDNILITGKFGAEPIPSNIKQAVFWTTKYLIDKTTVDENVTIDKGMDRTLHFKKETEELPYAVKMLLNKFKVIRAFEDA